MRSLIQATPAYELSVDIGSVGHVHNLRFISFVPTARRPEEQVKLQGLPALGSSPRSWANTVWSLTLRSR